MSEHAAVHTLSLRTVQQERGWSPGSFDPVVEVTVDGQEVTRQAAGRGMSVGEVLRDRRHRWAAPDEPITVPFASCGCGEYGCASTDITIRRDGDLVRWHFTGKTPPLQDLAFEAVAYDAEITRHVADHSWELPGDTAERLLRAQLPTSLAADRLTLDYAGTDGQGQFTVGLTLTEEEGRHYQVFLEVPESSDPARMAEEMTALLATDPREWECSWITNDRSVRPPSLMGFRWHRTSSLPERDPETQEVTDLLTAGLRELDPAGVGPEAPADEYANEAEIVADEIFCCESADDLAGLLQECVDGWFHPLTLPPRSAYQPMAEQAWARWQDIRPEWSRPLPQ